MESIVHRFFFYQWQRKLITLLTAFLIWTFVNHTITSTKVIPAVPIRLINMPPDKTVQGLLSNGFLIRRMPLTLTGTKDVIEQIEPGDLEVIIDAAILPNETVIQVTKKNLISLNPNLNLSKHITSVSNPEFILKMSSLVTEKIPISILKPIGVAPEGYEFLDVWPLSLFQTVSGPHDQVLELKNEGVEITFDLDEITREDLDALYHKRPSSDEVSFMIPDSWKKVTIPFIAKSAIPINDPDEKLLQLNFLKKSLLPIKNFLPLQVYYPTKYSDEVNPKTYPLKSNKNIQIDNDISFLAVPLYASGISKIFLDVVKDYLELQIIALPAKEQEELEWSISFVGENYLISQYIALELAAARNNENKSTDHYEYEKQFRERFDFYKEKLKLYLNENQPLNLDSHLSHDGIELAISNSGFNSKLSK